MGACQRAGPGGGHGGRRSFPHAAVSLAERGGEVPAIPGLVQELAARMPASGRVGPTFVEHGCPVTEFRR